MQSEAEEDVSPKLGVKFPFARDISGSVPVSKNSWRTTDDIDVTSTVTDKFRMNMPADFCAMSSSDGGAAAKGNAAMKEQTLSALGPPLQFLPKDISPEELDAYRFDYQAFRAGCAAGARGEIGYLCPTQQELEAPWGVLERRPYEEQARTKGQEHFLRRSLLDKHRVRLVPLIGLKLGSSSAALSALSAASELGGASSKDANDKLAPERMSSKNGSSGASAGASAKAMLQNGGNRLADMASSATANVKDAVKLTGALSPVLSHMSQGSDDQFPVGTHSTEAATYMCLKGTYAPDALATSSDQAQPWLRGSARQGVGLLVHILGSLFCLLPALMLDLHGGEASYRDWSRCLGLPLGYVAVVMLVAASSWRIGRRKSKLTFAPSHGVKAWRTDLTHVMRMDRVVREGCVPSWFPWLCAIMYVIVAVLLAWGRTFGAEPGSKRISLWSVTPQRHDYSCWGADSMDVADCILVRHSACTMLASLYTCLLATAAINRSVVGAGIAQRHRQSLLELFPPEAPALFSYVERSVHGNEASWRSCRRYKAQATCLSLAWTVTSFMVYAGLLEDATTLARAAFLAAVPCTFALQFTLLRHVLLSVLLHLEAVKARAAALAYCDECVLPFNSAHAIYVWFSVRRNVQAQNEVAYQLANPIFAASLVICAASSFWVSCELSRRGRSVFQLTSHGGASLMAVATACVSCCFVGVFLGTLMEIGKMEEAHLRQLHIAHLRLEHERLWPRHHRRSSWNSSSTIEPRQEADCGVLDGAGEIDVEMGRRGRSGSGGARARHSSEDFDVDDDQENKDFQGAIAMITKIVDVLEHHDTKASVLGIEIGSKSFQGAYAALMANGWYLLVWGVLIPVMSSSDANE